MNRKKKLVLDARRTQNSIDEMRETYKKTQDKKLLKELQVKQQELEEIKAEI